MLTRCWVLVLTILVGGCAAEAVGDAGSPEASVDKDAGADGRVDGATPKDTSVDATTDSLAADVLPPDVLSPDVLSPDIGVPKQLGCGVETLAGGAKPGTYDGYRQLARFNNPVNIGALPNGDLLVSDFDNNRIRRITVDGLVTTVAQIARPFGLTVASDGTVYVQTDRPAGGATTNEGAIWTLDPQSGATTLVLDKSGRARGFAVLPDGRLVLADVDRHTVSLFDPKTQKRTLLAGQDGVAGFADGTGSQARFDIPYDVLVENSTSLIVADMRNSRLRRISVADGKVTTFAGNGASGSSDGSLLLASFNEPKGLAQGPAGEIYVSESGGRVVRRIEGGMVTTIAGTGVAGHGDDDDPLKALFYAIEGITVGAKQKFLYLADGNQGDGSGHHRVRRIGIPPCTLPSDGGVPDAAMEAGMDAGVDQGLDGSPDLALADQGADAPADAKVDAAAADQGVDATGDAAGDQGGDGKADSAADQGADAKADKGADS